MKGGKGSGGAETGFGSLSKWFSLIRKMSLVESAEIRERTQMTRSLRRIPELSPTDSYPTVFASVPMKSMVMEISSPLARVKSDSGTIPVPVMR